ncbi:MAG: DoxX family protein [Bdellovibrionaceae bacterium]|nr:DoxX family protein [Pseudobdellovibrionaceae bacterium]
MSEAIAKFLLRVSVGGMMLPHGLGKIQGGIAFIKSIVVKAGLPEFFAYGIFIGEVVAPLLLIIGYKTKWAGYLLSFNILVATILVHSGDILTLSPNGSWAIEIQMFYIVTGLVIALLGAGKFSIDRK